MEESKQKSEFVSLKQEEENQLFDIDIMRAGVEELESVLSLKSNLESMVLSPAEKKAFKDNIDHFYISCIQSGIDFEPLTNLLTTVIHIERDLSKSQLKSLTEGFLRKFDTLKRIQEEKLDKILENNKIVSKEKIDFMKENFYKPFKTEEEPKLKLHLNLNSQVASKSTATSSPLRLDLSNAVKDSSKISLNIGANNNFRANLSAVVERKEEVKKEEDISQKKKEGLDKFEDKNKKKDKIPSKNKKAIKDLDSEERKKIEMARKDKEEFLKKEKDNIGF